MLAHSTGNDPSLSYANAAALQLWETRWDELIGMPSQLTAPDSERAERSSALGQARGWVLKSPFHIFWISCVD